MPQTSGTVGRKVRWLEGFLRDWRGCGGAWGVGPMVVEVRWVRKLRVENSRVEANYAVRMVKDIRTGDGSYRWATNIVFLLQPFEEVNEKRDKE